MRIGIITIPFNNNYGGYLQSYALLSILKQMGHDPTIIMRRHNIRPTSVFFRLKFFLKGLLKTLRKVKPYTCIYNVEAAFRQQGYNMLPFAAKYIVPQTKYIYTTDDLRQECNGKFDVYVVGSDQVWRSIYVPGIIGNMFLDFTDGWDVKRIAYAASFGTDTPEYTDAEKITCGELIKKFDAVAVRENSGLKVLKNFQWQVKNPQVVLDPTLLLKKEDYNKILPNDKSPATGKIFCYLLNRSEDAAKSISRIIQQLNKHVYEIVDIQKDGIVLPSIETWLTAIRDADFVITDSFHGTVFSILFNKSFVVYVNRTRGACRFADLLRQFGLENHIIGDDIDLNCVFNTDWAEVNNLVAEKRSQSKLFIYNSLSKLSCPIN